LSYGRLTELLVFGYPF